MFTSREYFKEKISEHSNYFKKEERDKLLALIDKSALGFSQIRYLFMMIRAAEKASERA